jgi:hypothetical protein
MLPGGGGTPGTKIVNVVFPRIKLKKVIKNDPLFKPDRNKSILKGAAKRPYPSSSFIYVFPSNKNGLILTILFYFVSFLMCS